MWKSRSWLTREGDAERAAIDGMIDAPSTGKVAKARASDRRA